MIFERFFGESRSSKKQTFRHEVLQSFRSNSQIFEMEFLGINLRYFKYFDFTKFIVHRSPIIISLGKRGI